MSVPVLASIVEGYGETSALPVLLRRLIPTWRIAPPIRVKRHDVLKEGRLEHYLGIAKSNVAEAGAGCVLVLLDADDDLPCVLAPELTARANSFLPHLPTHVVLATRCYEAWLVAGLDFGDGSPPEPDRIANPKKVLSDKLGRYRETTEQPSLTASMDISRAQARSPSFDKLMRTLEEIETSSLREED